MEQRLDSVSDSAGEHQQTRQLQEEANARGLVKVYTLMENIDFSLIAYTEEKKRLKLGLNFSGTIYFTKAVPSAQEWSISFRLLCKSTSSHR